IGSWVFSTRRGYSPYSTGDSLLFAGRLINRDLWPARTTDLTPLDYLLFLHLKNTVFKEPLHTSDDLIIKITSNPLRIGACF
ncbi:unnamed protein product, partial [Tenebrio molitor]